MTRLIKRFCFEPEVRYDLTYSDPAKIRLNADDRRDPKLTLKAPFTTDTDAVVTTWITKPNKLLQILGFDHDAEVPESTDVLYRLVNGADEFYWDGAAWSTPSDAVAHWNTVAQVNANISALPLTSREISVKVNLRTTDPSVSPSVRSIGILAEFDINWWDDLIYDTVVKSLQDTLRSSTDIEFEVASNTSAIDLGGTYKLDNHGYNFTGVLRAYNLTADPEKLNNIADSYTPGAARPDGTFDDGIVNLTTSVNATDILLVTMEIVPEIAVNTNQDYYEQKRIPAVVFERISQVRPGDGSGQEDNHKIADVYRNFEDYTGVIVYAPRQIAARFDYAIMANLSSDEAKLSTAIDKFVANNPLIKTWGMDEKVRLDHERGLERSGSVNLDDVRTSTGAFILRSVPFYLKDSEDVALVEDFNLSLRRRTDT